MDVSGLTPCYRCFPIPVLAVSGRQWRTAQRPSVTMIFHEAAESFTKDAENRFLYGWSLIPQDTFAFNP